LLVLAFDLAHGRQHVRSLESMIGYLLIKPSSSNSN
jgi:hypothetical protein